jgi:hypothetical protein
VFGCAPGKWSKDGAAQQDFATDSYDCEKDARQSGYYGGGLVGAANMQGFFNRCMEAHGWRLVNAASTSASITTSSPSFTRDQWEDAKRTCHDQATAQSNGTGNFPEAFDRCMRSHGM